jgi:branched-subunit amino acid transport protein
MWAAVLVAGLASLLLRVLPLLALGRLELSERASAALQHAATGALAVMLVTTAAHVADAASTPAGAPTGGTSVPTAGRVLGVALAVGLGLVLSRRGRSMPVVVLAGLVAYAGVTGASLLVAAWAR